MKKVVIIYWSGTGNTEAMAEAIGNGAEELAEVKVLYVAKATKEDVITADAVALGCPAMGDEVLEEDEMEPFVQSLVGIKWDDKPLALFGSYDWGDGEWMREWEKRMCSYGATLVQKSLMIQSMPDEDALNQCKALGKKLVAAI